MVWAGIVCGTKLAAQLARPRFNGQNSAPLKRGPCSATPTAVAAVATSLLHRCVAESAVRFAFGRLIFWFASRFGNGWNWCATVPARFLVDIRLSLAAWWYHRRLPSTESPDFQAVPPWRVDGPGNWPGFGRPNALLEDLRHEDRNPVCVVAELPVNSVLVLRPRKLM